MHKPNNQPKVSQNNNISPKLPHLLLVEDNVIALRSLESITQQAGAKFTSTLDGEKALELAKTIKFDLIIADIGLPGMSGIEMTIYIRHWEQSCNKVATPIVGLTAHSLASSAYECLEAGMNKVFAKPINLEIMQYILGTLTRTYQTVKDMSLSNTAKLEDVLSTLKTFPVFNLETGMHNLGSTTLLQELLTLMLNEVIPQDTIALQKAYAEKNWQDIEKIVHKMKSGAIYCGTTKLQYACQYLEHYAKAGHKELLDKLYRQLISILEETKAQIAAWLKNK